MKKITLILIGLTLLAGTSCKKDKTEEPTPTPSATVCLITKEANDDGSYTNNTYNSNNQIIASNSYNASDSSSEDLTWTYVGNKVTVTGGMGGAVQNLYLNSKGLIDSGRVSLSGLAELYIQITYNAAGEPITEATSGEIFGNPFEQTTTIEFTNGNRTKETLDDGTTTDVTTYEYYTDKLNLSAKSEEAATLMHSNKNLLKRMTNSDGSYTAYTYEFDANGKVTKQTETSSTADVIVTNYTWKCN
jgi:hypothetical protein